MSEKKQQTNLGDEVLQIYQQIKDKTELFGLDLDHDLRGKTIVYTVQDRDAQEWSTATITNVSFIKSENGQIIFMLEVDKRYFMGGELLYIGWTESLCWHIRNTEKQFGKQNYYKCNARLAN